MDSSSLAILLHQINVEIAELRLPFMNSDLFSITDEQFRIVGRYALELSVDSNFRLQMHQKWSHNQVWKRRSEPQNRQIVSEMVLSFLQDDVKELFKLPKSSQFPHQKPLKKNELVAAFIGFLLQILHHGEHYDFMDNSQALMAGLRSLVAILGDTPFQATEHQQLQSLLAEFEDVANEAGSIVHSVFFSFWYSLVFPADPHPGPTHDGILALLHRIDSLKPNIIDVLNLLPNTILTPKMNSVFAIDSLVYDLEDMLNRDYNLAFEDLKDLIRMLHQQLKPTQSLIKDIELLKLSKDEGSEQVMVQIRDIAYDAEYLINSFLVGDAPCWYLTLRLTHLIETMKTIGTDPSKMKNDYDVGAMEVAEVSTEELSQVHSDPDVGDIISVFEDQENDILDRLLRGTKKLESVFIVGMAGVGKTTLAHKLFNHPSLCCHFDKKVWCTVLHKPHWRNLFISILSRLTYEVDAMDEENVDDMDEENVDDMDEETLTLKVYQCLKFRRFMIVVDDIWQPDHWQYLARSFPDDQNGSRILLTSRNGNICESCSIIHQLLPWSDNQCLQLIHTKVFKNYESGNFQLGEIGKEIAAKCYGLPLVAVVVAGMLSAMDKQESSLKIVNNNLDYYEHFDQSRSIEHVLELSYKNLPSYLKPCFLYFGMFQEDAEIFVKKLKRLWISEGFICKQVNERAENVAEKYMKELIDKNLVIVTKRRKDGGAKACVIHDLLRDLCLKKAKEENFLTWTDREFSIHNRTYRRLCVNGPSFVAPFGLGLRSLFVDGTCINLSLLGVKLLRVLESRTCDLFGIELLFHLNYLATDNLSTEASIPKNVNLEFLTVNEPVVLTPEILKMLKLRYLSSPMVEFGTACGTGTIQTSNLEFLSTLKIHNKMDEEMLRHLPHLYKLKCQYQWSLEEMAGPSLDFHFLTQCESLRVTIFDIAKIIDITLPSNVRKLHLVSLRLPWEKMSLISALPNLQVLKLGRDTFVGEMWDTGDDEFRKLRYLEMEGLRFTEWLIRSSGQFPRLQQLVLKNCDNLIEIPTEIGDITLLCVIKVEGWCLPSLVNSAMNIEKEQREFGNDELKVILSDIIDSENWIE